MVALVATAIVVAALLAWGAYVVVRQVPAISWVELPDEIVIRRGRIFRRMVVVPYGRLQYVDLQSGPLMRHIGLATIEIHTATPSSSGEVPGLPTEVAESLRERLSERGESLRAGL
jgi:membrane protein YdbS with pleckstrin-like domain